MVKQLMNYLFFPMRFYVDGGEGGGSGSGAGDDGGGDGDTGGAAAGAAGSGGANSGAAGRPEGLEESFWDSEKGEVRMESLIKSHNDTRKSVHEKEEGVRERLMSEMQSARPESPEAYEMKDLGIDAPEGYEIKFDDKDPMMEMWKKMCFQNNSSNDQFMEGVRTYVKQGMDSRVDPEAEQVKLGENGADRIQRIELLMNKHLDQGEVDSLADVMLTAESIVAIEKLLEGIGESRLPGMDGENSFNKKLTRGDLEEMMKDQRYHGRGGGRSEEFIAKVRQGFANLK
jgi:hypothetical protein